MHVHSMKQTILAVSAIALFSAAPLHAAEFQESYLLPQGKQVGEAHVTQNMNGDKALGLTHGGGWKSSITAKQIKQPLPSDLSKLSPAAGYGVTADTSIMLDKSEDGLHSSRLVFGYNYAEPTRLADSPTTATGALPAQNNHEVKAGLNIRF
jgi:hypothetical protein